MAILAYCYYASITYDWDRDYENQKLIAKAYANFYIKQRHFPNNIQEIVTSGYLPQQATFYMEPPGPFPKLVAAQDGCYVVQPPPGNNIENLHMVGRRCKLKTIDVIEYEPPVNAMIRDAIIKAQHPMDIQKYNNYIAPLETNR
jgi:hypothetical protein